MNIANKPTHWAFKNLLWVGAGIESRTQYLPATAPSRPIDFNFDAVFNVILNNVFTHMFYSSIGFLVLFTLLVIMCIKGRVQKHVYALK